LKQLDKRYRTRYGMSMIDNLNMINEFGIRHFIHNEKDKWICPKCGELICVHRPTCLTCGYKWN
jgi:ribosomal protein L37AE/L43A